MESAGVRYLPTRCFCIRNRTSERSERVRFLIRQQLLCKYRSQALSMKYSLYMIWYANYMICMQKKLLQVPPRIKLGSLDWESIITGPRLVLLVYVVFFFNFQFTLRKLQNKSSIFTKKNVVGPTEIWTRIAGFRVQSANHYTMGPFAWQIPENGGGFF